MNSKSSAFVFTMVIFLLVISFIYFVQSATDGRYLEVFLSGLIFMICASYMLKEAYWYV